MIGKGIRATGAGGNLRAGNGVPQLEGGLTVFDNGAANALTGNGNEAAGILNLF